MFWKERALGSRLVLSKALIEPAEPTALFLGAGLEGGNRLTVGEERNLDR